MFHVVRIILIAVCLTVLSTQISAHEVSNLRFDAIPHPELEKLYEEADLVAFVKIVSGDTENFEDTVYKSTVLTAYKGTHARNTIFFGPYFSYGIGSDYLVFLKKAGKTIGKISTKDKEARTVLYDESSEYFRVMYGGYSILPVSYECALGPASGSDSCEYAINAESIILPKTIRSFPKEYGDKTEAKPFVRKRNTEELLSKLSKQ